LPEIKKKFDLDFDDAYQYKVASDHDLEIVTMDRNFEKTKHEIKVAFL
jgi:predicted nucleic acid-binding protein